MTQERMIYGFTDTPYGEIIVAQDTNGLRWLAFLTGTRKEAVAVMQKRLKTSNIKHDDRSIGNWQTEPVHVRGTPFQEDVWKALQDIPSGKTMTYQDIAYRVGRPQAVRAVGSAIGANPISMRIPCHRVIRSDGGMGGYAWGIERKKALLSAEAV